MASVSRTLLRIKDDLHEHLSDEVIEGACRAAGHRKDVREDRPRSAATCVRHLPSRGLLLVVMTSTTTSSQEVTCLRYDCKLCICAELWRIFK